MGKRTHLSVRVEDYIARELNSIAQTSGVSVTDVITEYLTVGIERSGESHIFDGTLRVALDASDLNVLKQVANMRKLSPDEMAAYLVTKSLGFFRKG